MKVEYLDHMGTDLSVVNAARVSFGKRSDWAFVNHDKDGKRNCVLYPQDKSLIWFLARGCESSEWSVLSEDIIGNTQVVDGEWVECYDMDEHERMLNHIRKMPSHWSPFAHTAISLRLKMPIFVARQIMKHTTGIEYNEVSRRYDDSEPEFYVPEVWRKRADNVKQGSSDEAARLQEGIKVSYSQDLTRALDNYKHLVEDCKVAPEQARMVLPQSMYTQVIMTGNLYAIANLYNQRIDPHAQKETQEIARQIGEIVEPLYPESWKALTE